MQSGIDHYLSQVFELGRVNAFVPTGYNDKTEAMSGRIYNLSDGVFKGCSTLSLSRIGYDSTIRFFEDEDLDRYATNGSDLSEVILEVKSKRNQGVIDSMFQDGRELGLMAEDDTSWGTEIYGDEKP